MKKRFTKIPVFLKKKLIFACFLGSVIFLFVIGSYLCKRDTIQFEKITNRLFLNEMLNDTLSMHYSLAHPEEFGIADYAPALPCYHPQDPDYSRNSLENTLRELNDINKKKLSPDNARLCTQLIRYLKNSLERNRYFYYRNPLSPSSGIHSQFPILMAEYTFRSKQDVEDYLVLLEQSAPYFESLLSYLKDKTQRQLPVSYASLMDTAKQCDTLVTYESLEQNSHFLQTTFKERLLFLLKDGAITTTEYTDFLSENERLLQTVLAPQYENLGDGLSLLCDRDNTSDRLGSFPRGKDYYTHLLVAETGSYRSVSDIRQMLADRFVKESEILHNLLKNASASYALSSNLPAAFPLTAETEMLNDLQSRMAPLFPPVEGQSVEVVVKDVDSSMEEYCAPAFYLTAPLDDTTNNVIYINRNKTPSGLELYTTLAHEGFPGHLYQTVYSNRHALKTGQNPVRELLWYGGYLEGWALYCEFLSYDFAANLSHEKNLPAYADFVQIEKHNREMQLCLFSMLDIMIHYENQSPDAICDFLSRQGIDNRDAILSLYEYISEEPCNYLKYYLGYLEILSLKEKAVDLWQDGYTDYAFHKYLLEYGPADFLTLEEYLQTVNPKTLNQQTPNQHTITP